CERRRTIGHCGREPGEGCCHANIEQWVQPWRGAPLSVGSAVTHRLQPEEAMPIPMRAGDRLGDLRKAAVDAAVPGVPVVEDHDPLAGRSTPGPAELRT